MVASCPGAAPPGPPGVTRVSVQAVLEHRQASSRCLRATSALPSWKWLIMEGSAASTGPTRSTTSLGRLSSSRYCPSRVRARLPAGQGVALEPAHLPQIVLADLPVHQPVGLADDGRLPGAAALGCTARKVLRARLRPFSSFLSMKWSTARCRAWKHSRGWRAEPAKPMALARLPWGLAEGQQQVHPFQPLAAVLRRARRRPPRLPRCCPRPASPRPRPGGTRPRPCRPGRCGAGPGFRRPAAAAGRGRRGAGAAAPPGW